MGVLDNIGNRVDQGVNAVTDKIQEGVSNGLHAIGNEIISELTDLSSKIVDVAAIGVVGYIYYNCALMMFFGEEKSSKKILFGYYGLLLLRILNAVLKVKHGV